MASNSDSGCGVVILVLAVILAIVALQAWFIMLVWGSLASVFGFQTISYGTAILIGAALSIVGSFFRKA